MGHVELARIGMRPVRMFSSILRRYFGARGPHLAAMLAYYALLSLFPFVFLAASLVSAVGRPEETSTLLRDLSHVLPGTSAHDLSRLVRSLESNAAEIGLIGGVALLWSSLGFLSALESGLNVIYGLPNRGFLHQKLVMLGLLGTALLGLLLGLTVVVTSQTALSEVAPDLAHLAAWRIGGGLAISSLTTFLFLLLVYRTLPNTEVTTRQVLLVWLYIMGNVVLLGGAITWWSSRGRDAAAATAAVAQPDSASV